MMKIQDFTRLFCLFKNICMNKREVNISKQNDFSQTIHNKENADQFTLTLASLSGSIKTKPAAESNVQDGFD